MKKLALVMAVLCYALTATAAEPDSLEKLGWQLGVHSYTFKEFPFNEAVDKTQALGVKYMSISGGLILDGKSRRTAELSDEEIKQVREKVAAAGLTLVNCGVVQLPPDEAKSRKVFEFAKKLGIDTLVAEPEAKALDIVEKLCKEYNIKVAIHEHPKPNIYWQPENVLAAIKGRTPLMGACADVGHWARSGLDPTECLKKLDGHVLALHFKDLNARGEVKAHDVPWGTGTSDVKSMMTELKRQKFHGAILVEYEYNWKASSPEIAESLKYFRLVADELVKADAK